MADFQKIVLDEQTNNKSVGLTVSKGTINDSTLNEAVLNKAVLNSASVTTKEYGLSTLEETFNKITQKIDDIINLVDSGDTLFSLTELAAELKTMDAGLNGAITSLSDKLSSRITELDSATTKSINSEAEARKTEDTLQNWRFNFQPSIVANVTVDAQMIIDGTVSVDNEFIGDAQGFINGVFFAASAVLTRDGYTYSVELPPTAQIGMNVVVYGLAAVSNTFYPELPVSNPDAGGEAKPINAAK